MANDKTREILINFKANGDEVKKQLEDVIITLDKTSAEYQEAVDQLNIYNQTLDQVNATLNNTNATQTELDDTISKATTQWSNADKVVKTHQRNLNSNVKSTKDQTVATKSLTTSVTENGGAMAILSTITGGWAMTVKDGIEAMGLFNGEVTIGSRLQQAYAAVVGTSTGALKAFKIALAATGIGLAVVLLTELISNWDRLGISIGNATKELDEYQQQELKGASRAKILNQERAETIAYLRGIIENEKLAMSARQGAADQLNKLLKIEDESNKIKVADAKVVGAKISRYSELADRTTKLTESERAYNIAQDKAIELDAKRNELLTKTAELRRQLGDGKVAKYAESSTVGEFAELRKVEEDIKQNTIQLTNARANYNQALANTSTQEGLINNSINEQKRLEDERKKAADARKVASDKAAEAERQRLENEKKLLTEIEELRRKYNVLLTDNPQDKLRIELENRRLELLDQQNIKQTELDTNVLKGTEKYNKAQKVINDYYNAELQKIEEVEDSLWNFSSEWSAIQEKNSKLLESGTLKDLEKIKFNVDEFISSIKNPEVKNAFSDIFDAKDVDKRINELKQIEQLLSKTQTQLRPLDQGIDPTTSISSRNTIIQNNRDFNNQIYTDNENADIKQLELLNASLEEQQRVRDYYNNLRKTNNDEANKAIELSNRDHWNANLEIAQIYSQNTMALIDAGLEFASEADKEKIKSSGEYKALMIGLTTIDTLSGATAAFMSAQSSYPAPYGTIIGAGLAAGVLASGMANVKKIKSVKIGGTSGGGGGDTSTAMAQPNVNFVSSDTNQISNSVTKSMNNMNNEPLKAYVTVGDIDNAQQLQRQKVDSNSI